MKVFVWQIIGSFAVHTLQYIYHISASVSSFRLWTYKRDSTKRHSIGINSNFP